MTTLLHRRALLRQWIGMFAALASWRRKDVQAMAQTGGGPTNGYLDLREPVEVPASRIAEPWSAVPFDAWLPRPGATDRGVLLKGIAVRTAAVAGSAPAGNGGVAESAGAVAGAPQVAGEIKAFCRLCPHEICNVGYVTDSARVHLESGDTPPHPLLVCPCHFSVFDPLADGARISGPAFSGLYQFTTTVRQDKVEITQVEENILTLLS